VRKTRPLILTIIISVIGLIYLSEINEVLTLENVKTRLRDLELMNRNYPRLTMVLFTGLYIMITSLSIPGAIVLTLLAGALFGVMVGTLLVTLSCTIGATIAFFLSRFLFRETIFYRFRTHYLKINQRFIQKGNSYLFTLRLIPASAYVVINLLMGLTSINPWSFIWITFTGMLPGNLIYVFAGERISEIKSADEILTSPVIFFLVLIGFLPLILRWTLKFLKKETF
jgi:uncharacterized membrane protein YdjX (TVP38/TMEM64 family)